MALPIAVLPSRGGRVISAMLSANRLASAASPIRVQGTTVSNVFGPAHWTSVTATARLPPTVRASAICGSRKAAAWPRNWNSRTPVEMLLDASTASTSSRSTGLPSASPAQALDATASSATAATTTLRTRIIHPDLLMPNHSSRTKGMADDLPHHRGDRVPGQTVHRHPDPLGLF